MTGFIEVFQIDKKMNFWIYGLMDFCIFLDICLYRGNEKIYLEVGAQRATRLILIIHIMTEQYTALRRDVLGFKFMCIYTLPLQGQT